MSHLLVVVTDGSSTHSSPSNVVWCSCRAPLRTLRHFPPSALSGHIQASRVNSQCRLALVVTRVRQFTAGTIWSRAVHQKVNRSLLICSPSPQTLLLLSLLNNIDTLEAFCTHPLSSSPTSIARSNSTICKFDHRHSANDHICIVNMTERVCKGVQTWCTAR